MFYVFLSFTCLHLCIRNVPLKIVYLPVYTYLWSSIDAKINCTQHHSLLTVCFIINVSSVVKSKNTLTIKSRGLCEYILSSLLTIQLSCLMIKWTWYKTQAIQNQTTFSTLSLGGGCTFICVYVNQETSARAPTESRKFGILMNCPFSFYC